MKISVPENGRSLDELIRQATYMFYTAVALPTWTINHKLGKFPSVICVDASGNVIFGNIQYVTDNQITVTFNADTAGKAYLN